MFNVASGFGLEAIPFGTVAQAIQKGPDGQMIKKSIMLTPAQMVILLLIIIIVNNQHEYYYFVSKTSNCSTLLALPLPKRYKSNQQCPLLIKATP